MQCCTCTHTLHFTGLPLLCSCQCFCGLLLLVLNPCVPLLPCIMLDLSVSILWIYKSRLSFFSVHVKLGFTSLHCRYWGILPIWLIVSVHCRVCKYMQLCSCIHTCRFYLIFWKISTVLWYPTSWDTASVTSRSVLGSSLLPGSEIHRPTVV